MFHPTIFRKEKNSLLWVQIPNSASNYAGYMGGSFYGKFWETKIWNFCSHVHVKKNIAGFQIPMDDGGDTAGMKVLDTWNGINAYYDQLDYFYSNKEIQQSPVLTVVAN